MPASTPAGLSRFLSPDEAAAVAFAARAKPFHLSAAAIKELSPAAPRDDVTGFFDARQDGVKNETVMRAQNHVGQTRDNAFYLSGDIFNLGGLNAAMNNVAEAANVHYREIANIVASEVGKLKADVVPMRTGGDEIGMLLVGPASDQDLRRAIRAATARIEQYGKSHGLSEIPHPKRKGDKGVGMHMGAAAVLPGMTVSDICARADLELDKSKTGSKPPAATTSATSEVANVPQTPTAQTDPVIRGPEVHYEMREATRLQSPDAVAAAGFAAVAAKHNLSEAAVQALAPRAARDDVTGFYDARQDGLKSATVQRAQDHVAKSADNAFFLSGDIFNLGGLNAAMNNVAEAANVHYRAIAGIVAHEASKLPADIIPMRTGGDEVAVLLVGSLSEKDLQAAMQAARSRITEYTQAHGLSEIPHPKRQGDKGVGMHMGTAPVLPGMTVMDICTQADLQLDRSKTHVQS